MQFNLICDSSFHKKLNVLFPRQGLSVILIRSHDVVLPSIMCFNIFVKVSFFYWWKLDMMVLLVYYRTITTTTISYIIFMCSNWKLMLLFLLLRYDTTVFHFSVIVKLWLFIREPCDDDGLLCVIDDTEPHKKMRIFYRVSGNNTLHSWKWIHNLKLPDPNTHLMCSLISYIKLSN